MLSSLHVHLRILILVNNKIIVHQHLLWELGVRNQVHILRRNGLAPVIFISQLQLVIIERLKHHEPQLLVVWSLCELDFIDGRNELKKNFGLAAATEALGSGHVLVLADLIELVR